MSQLTKDLLTERPTRELCRKGVNRIDALEDALLDLEAHLSLPNRKLKITMLHHVQRALYDKDLADRMARERGETF